MNWLEQGKIFIDEIKATRATSNKDESVSLDDMEFVSSASEARLLAVPQGASFLIMVALVCAFIIMIWALVMQVDEVAKAQGKVIPSKQVQVIQTLEGGIVKKINVVEGQAVSKGDILLITDDVYAKSDVTENANSYNALLARFVALNALIDGKRILNFPDELKAYLEIMAQERERFNEQGNQNLTKIKELEYQIEQKRKEYEDAISKHKYLHKDHILSQQEVELNKPLLKSGAVSKVEFLHLEQKFNEAEKVCKNAKNDIPKMKARLHEAMQKRESYIHQYTQEYEKERNEIKSKLNTMQSKGVSLQAKLSHSIIKSPVDGTVKKINFNTIGGVIRPGMEVMQIVPSDDQLLIEVKVKPKDVGFIELGQKAKVKITAFDFSTYGGLEGEVKFISADTITNKKGISFYLARIKTKTNNIIDKKGKKHTIIPGMRTEVDIILDQKNILTFILKPMLK